MTKHTLSRRGFLKTSAATAAIAAGGGLTYSQWVDQAYAEDEEEHKPEIKIASSTCNACSNKCGLKVFTKDGRLWKLLGEELHPNSKGTLCARGHGFATNAYSDARLTEPLKKNEDGTHSPISWDQAYQEIGTKVKEIIKKYGPQAIAMSNDPRPSGAFYSKRFINALGSDNYYSHISSCNLSRNTGFVHSVGGVPAPDLENAECIMFIGRSYGDGINPSSAKRIADAAERGAYIIIVDPRFNSTAHMADEWVPIRPGTDLAFVLAMSNVLVNEGLYDKEFIETYTVGFDEFAENIQQYTPAWASEKTTIDEDRIIDIAHTMAKHAPKSFIEQSWRAAMGCSYRNSVECARSVALFNALLGCYQTEGGLNFGNPAPLGELDDETLYKPLPEPVDVNYALKHFPLAPKGDCTNVIPIGIENGDIKAVFYYNANPCMGYGNPKQYSEILSKAEMIVAIDVQMSETCCIADYVLPDTTYLERKEVPAVIGDVISVRMQALDKIHPNTRPVDQIFTELAEACGVGDYFTFTVDDVIDSQISIYSPEKQDEIRKTGIANVADEMPPAPTERAMPTPDGKIHFADDIWTKGKLDRNVQWVDLKCEPDTSNDDEFRMIAGKQAIHTHTSTTNVPYLIQITKDYGLERIWMNADRAERLGIKEGDWVTIDSEVGHSEVQVHVTQLLHPDCIWTASHYGTKSPFLKNGLGMGVASMDHTPFDHEPAVGSAMTQENIVHVRKMEV